MVNVPITQDCHRILCLYIVLKTNIDISSLLGKIKARPGHVPAKLEISRGHVNDKFFFYILFLKKKKVFFLEGGREVSPIDLSSTNFATHTTRLSGHQKGSEGRNVFLRSGTIL